MADDVKLCIDCSIITNCKSPRCDICRVLHRKALQAIAYQKRNPPKNRVKITLCPKCKEYEKADYSDYCSKCAQQYNKEWYHKVAKHDPEKAQKARDNAKRYKPTGDKLRENQLKYLYNITLEKYNAMLEAQDHKCKICGLHELDHNTNLVVDHCHTTQDVRGLLCRKCNLGLGYFNDNKEIIMNAIKYLEGVN